MVPDQDEAEVIAGLRVERLEEGAEVGVSVVNQSNVSS
jgi:hypothetical protein